MSAAVIIDRKAVVSRHNVVYTGKAGEAAGIASPLSVGNGAFCVTVDYTGLQTFAGDSAAASFPLCTMAEWAWHRYPGAPADSRALRLEQFDTYGRQVGYASSDAGQEALFKRLRQSAHKFSLARISFVNAAGTALDRSSAALTSQTLDLWRGTITSLFTVDGTPVTVETFVSPADDTLCVKAVSAVIAAGALAVEIAFPYPSHKKEAADFTAQGHRGDLQSNAVSTKSAVFTRTVDGVAYTVTVTHDAPFKSLTVGAKHTVTIIGGTDTIDLAVTFQNGTDSAVYLPYKDLKLQNDARWEDFWQSGAFIALPRHRELERRVILSLYLTTIQSRGALPPAETGLTMNSWYGKYHMEMHCWHVAHFALWGRAGVVKKAMAYYRRILPTARKIAADQGYKGARWPKMCDQSAVNTPSSIAVLLVWQQPHPIMLATLAYAADPDTDFLKEYREVIVETAEWMLDFIHWDDAGKRYVLGPPLIPAQERFDPRTVLNPTYELEYFRWGFRAANDWLERLGEGRRADFDRAASLLAKPAVVNGAYVAAESCPRTFTEAPFNTDHPSMLNALGVVPDTGAVDHGIMSATIDAVIAHWDMQSLWGWDFPVMAMCAWTLGRRDDAIRFLLMDSPKNTYAPNGHNTQVDNDALPVYLPGNGGTLLAVAYMAEGLAADYGAQIEGFTKYPGGD